MCFIFGLCSLLALSVVLPGNQKTFTLLYIDGVGSVADAGYRSPWPVVRVGGRRQQETKRWCFDFPALWGRGGGDLSAMGSW